MTYTIIGAKYDRIERVFRRVTIKRYTYSGASSAKWCLLRAGWAAKIQVEFERVKK